MSKKAATWNKLDNAAKIFPCTATSKDSKVFRFSCELYETIQHKLLEGALEQTILHFPFYRSVLKKGLFWYFFETSPLTPAVKPETKLPCRQLYHGDRKSLLFEVTYYGKRINLEVFHALSDGTGALAFLKTLVYYYLIAAHKEALTPPPNLDYDASQTQKMVDSFSKYYEKTDHHKKNKPVIAHRLRGSRLPENRLSIIEGVIPVSEVLKVAHEYHTTLTGFLTATLLCAIHEGMTLREKKKPVVITVPVNLRNYFPSESTRNFFAVVNVGYDFGKYTDFAGVVNAVNVSLKKQLTAEHLANHMNGLSALEHSIFTKIVPLAIKDPCMRFASYLSEREVTAALSNVGKITMPPELCPYIRLFDVFTSTKRVQTCICSFEENLIISFTSPFISTDIQCDFFRQLAAHQISVEISSNQSNIEEVL